MADYYQILGVSRFAADAEIKKAFRLRARECHPDVNSGQNAKLEFQKINEAYQTLKDPGKRQLYDSMLVNGFPAQTVHYRPAGKVKYRARGDKYAHYNSQDEAEEQFAVFEKYIDIFLFIFMILLGAFGVLYGVYRVWINQQEDISPYYGMLMGFIITVAIALFWANKKRFFNE